MRPQRHRRAAGVVAAGLIVAALASCGGRGDRGDRDATAPAPAVVPVANDARDIVATALAFDVGAQTGRASVTFAASGVAGASLDVGDLVIDRVGVPFRRDGARLDLALPAANGPLAVEIEFHWRPHADFRGASPGGFTFLWPAACGNLFPCHTAPADGASFTLALDGVAPGQTAVYAGTIGPGAPAYQVAWAIGDYREVALGATGAGTRVSVWHLPGEADAALAGTRSLVAAFDWLERTLGAYRFGPRVGSVSVDWPGGDFGGMEHHPLWHVDRDSLADPVLHVHEAAHGWFGNGVRLACWEDFVLSEGTATYLAARALDAVAPAAGAQAWRNYAARLAAVPAASPVWPASCTLRDAVAGGLATDAPYLRGAFFYRAVADRVGAAALDRALATFYAEHAGGSATMDGMLQTIRRVTGYDAAACAQRWLRDAEQRPSPGPCP